MKTFHRNDCLGCSDFASYMNGTTYEDERTSIEQHLSDCDICFDTFISILNRYLDGTGLPIGSEPGAIHAYHFAA